MLKIQTERVLEKKRRAVANTVQTPSLVNSGRRLHEIVSNHPEMNLQRQVGIAIMADGYVAIVRILSTRGHSCSHPYSGPVSRSVSGPDNSSVSDSIEDPGQMGGENC